MNKEEIEESKKCLIGIIENTYAEEKAIKLDNLRKYIQHLEQKETILDKVTDKLLEDKKELMEELKYNITKREARMQLNLVDKYLGIIIEGEKE